MKDKLQQFATFLTQAGLKSTRQRSLIAEAFFRAGTHLSVEDLYRMVSAKHRRIGLVTVYRTLRLLRTAGLAEERQFLPDRSLFEPAPARHHDHMICTHCGKIIEFENCEIEALQEKMARRFGFTILTHKLELYGACRPCHASRRRIRSPAPLTARA